jgi:hypothetical protein
MPKKPKSEKVPKAMQPTFQSIAELTDEFSKKYLNDEYAQLIRYAAAALCRKRPSPLASGTINSWACGITYAIGFVNFLFDKSEEPYINASDLCSQFGVSKSTGSSKSKVVRDALDLMQLDPNWCLPITYKGLAVDARYMPRAIQEIAYRKGLIPYIPGDKSNS